MTPDQVVGWARELLGAPFAHQGSSVYGCDCIGVIRHVWRRAGLPELQVPPYGREPDAAMVAEMLGKHGVLIDVYAAQPGDVLVFRFAKDPQHFGIVTSIGARRGLLHAHLRDGKVVEHHLTPAWERLACAAARFPCIGAQ